MTVFATKADLKAAVKDWLSEEGIDDETLNRAIALIEADMRRRLRVFQMEVTADFPIDSETETVPSRFLQPKRIYIPGYKPLIFQTQEQLVARQVGVSADRPLFYTIEGVEDALPILRFSPVPDSTYTARLTYIADPALLSDTDCNDILEQWPDLYQYGTLTQLTGYLHNEERLPGWVNAYESILQGIITADLKDKTSGSTLLPTKIYKVA